MSDAKLQCRAMTARGSPCSRPAGATGYCWQHSQQAQPQSREAAPKGSPGASSAAKSSAKQDRAAARAAGKHPCKGLTTTGDSCSRPAGAGGYCLQHCEQAQSSIASPAAISAAKPAGQDRVEAAAPPSSKPRCKGVTDRGIPCSRLAGASGYCWQHNETVAQAAGSTNGSSVCEAAAGSLGSGEQICNGKTGKGEPCSRPVGASGYCWQHTEQAAAPAAGSTTGGKSSRANSSNANGSSRTNGTSSNANRSSAIGSSSSSSSSTVPGPPALQCEASSSPTTSSPSKLPCQGTTAKGEPCSRPSGASGYCWQHGEAEEEAVLADASGSKDSGGSGGSSSTVGSAGGKPTATWPAASGSRPSTRADASLVVGSRVCRAMGADGQPCGKAAGMRGFCSAHIRSKAGGFKELHAVPAFFIDSQRCANINGTTEDTGQWLEWWARVTGREKELAQCCVEGCPARHSAAERLCGGHLWLWGRDGRVDKQTAYIAPLCKLHNSREFDYPKAGFVTRRNTAMMKMLPHECYEDFAFDYTLPASLLLGA